MKEKLFEILHNRKRMPGERFGDIEGKIEHLVNQEVERRIKERMPSDELIEEIQEKSLIEYENAPICEIDYYSGFEDGCKWLRSRLTNPGVNDSQKTEGGGE